MKKLFTLLIAITAFVVLGLQSAEASHAQGADITYTYTGTPNEYIITLRFYRDCAGIDAPPSVDICYSSASSGFSSTIIMFPIAGTGNPIPSSSCVTTPTNCTGFGGFGTEEWIYQEVLTLPNAANDWIFSYNVCCRNTQITTLANAGGQDIYVSATLNNLAFPTNSSPYFDSVPVTTFCVNNQFYYYQGAFDVDGDSLNYSLVPAEGNFSCPAAPTNLAYNAPFSATNPLQTLNGTTIDPLTGVISFLPNAIQVGVICVLVEEYDTTQFPAVKKGQVKRDLQILVISNCIVIQPAPSGLGSGGGYTNALFASCADTSVIVTLSDDVQCGSIAADGSDFRAIGPKGQPNPIFKAEGVNCVNGQTDSVRVFFYYPLTKTRTALYIKKGNDGNTMLSECGNTIYETNELDSLVVNDTINIIIQDTSIIDLNVPNVAPCVFKELTVNMLDQFICSTIRANGSDFKLVDATGTQFPLIQAYGACSGPTPLSPGSYTSTITVVAAQTVVGTSPYYLIALTGTDNNTIANLCETYVNVGDTLAVIDASAPLQVSLGADISQCANLGNPVLNTQLVGVTTSWLYNGNNLPDTASFISATQTGQYIVNVSASPTCNGSDTVNVNLIAAPTATILANGISTDQVTICVGTPFPTLDGTVAGAVEYVWTLNGTVVSNAATFVPTQDGSYTLQTSSLPNGGCATTDLITITTVQSIVVNLGNNITQCANVAPPVLDAGVFPGANYLWSNGETTQTVTATVAGTYIVTVTYGVNCSASDTIDVIFDAVPAIPALADQNICYNIAISPLNANPFGTQPPTATYTWTDAGGAVVGNAALFNPLVAGTYTVSISNNGCSVTDDATVTVEAQIPLNLGAPQTICGAPILIDAGFAGQVTAYNWTKDGSPFGNTQTINANGPGTYTVTTTTALGCTSVASVQINAGTFATTITGDNVICENSSATLDAGYTGTAVANFAWTLNGTATGSNANTITANAAGNYVVVITDEFGCVATDTASLAIENILVAPIPVCTAAPVGGTFAYIYTWNAIAGSTGYEISLDGGLTWIQPNTPSSPTSHGVAQPAQEFLVRALGTFCPTGRTSEPAPCQVVIPNVVTPNGDGKNDTFEMLNLGQYKGAKMSIYNRWGNVIYTSDDYGLANNYDFKDEPDGTYFYSLSIPGQEAKSGTITVFRKQK